MEKVLICPRCGSTDVLHNFDNPAFVATGTFQDSYKCKDCGYVGMVPEVDMAKLKDVQKSIRDRAQ